MQVKFLFYIHRYYYEKRLDWVLSVISSSNINKKRRLIHYAQNEKTHWKYVEGTTVFFSDNMSISEVLFAQRKSVSQN